MRYFEIIREAPQKIPRSQFNFNFEQLNKTFLRSQLKKIKEVIETTPDYDILRTGNLENGWIFLHNKHTELVDYVVQYQARNWKILPRTVTQCLLWRRQTSLYVQNLTQRMFFDYLLERFPAIMSDTIQTPEGNEFWVRRMANAISKGLKVSIVNVPQRKTVEYNPEVNNLEEFLTNNDAYGYADKYQLIRYIISR